MGGLQTFYSTVWGDNSDSGRMIILLIAAVASWALVRARRARRTLAHEIAWIQRASAVLREIEEPEEDGDDSTSKSASSADTEKLLERLEVGSLVQQRIAAIASLRGRRVRVSLSILQSLTASQLSDRGELRTPARSAQQCLMLGVLGTFFGLAILVQEIQFTLPATGQWAVESWTQSIENVAAVMGGIKTAFSTSLIGLTMALFLTAASHRVEDLSARVVRHLDYFTLHKLLPALAPELDDRSTLDHVARQMEEAYEALADVMEHNTVQIGQLSGIQSAFLDIVDQLRVWSRGEAEEDLAQLRDHLAETNQSVLRVAEQLPRAVDAIESSQRRFLERLSPGRTIASGIGQLWTTRIFGVPGSLVLIAVGLCAAIYVATLVA